MGYEILQTPTSGANSLEGEIIIAFKVESYGKSTMDAFYAFIDRYLDEKRY